MTECIFCKIVKGQIPCAKVYEDKDTFAFLDIAPIHKGHTLVIPKVHHETALDVPDELLKEVIIAVKKVAKAVKQATNAGGINFQLANHEIAGQSVFHAHFHIIPRHEGDGLKHWPQGKYDEGEMKEYAEKIKEHL